MARQVFHRGPLVQEGDGGLDAGHLTQEQKHGQLGITQKKSVPVGQALLLPSHHEDNRGGHPRLLPPESFGFFLRLPASEGQAQRNTGLGKRLGKRVHQRHRDPVQPGQYQRHLVV